MNNRVSKDQALNYVQIALADVEEAIRSHPDETVQLYERGKDAYEKGLERAEKTDWSERIGLTMDELSIIHKYLFAVSFMSAWYDNHNDKNMRDEAAQTACLVVGGTGFPPEEAMRHLIRYEKTWYSMFRTTDNMGNNRTGWVGYFALWISRFVPGWDPSSNESLADPDPLSDESLARADYERTLAQQKGETAVTTDELRDVVQRFDLTPDDFVTVYEAACRAGIEHDGAFQAMVDRRVVEWYFDNIGRDGEFSEGEFLRFTLLVKKAAGML